MGYIEFGQQKHPADASWQLGQLVMGDIQFCDHSHIAKALGETR